MKSATLLMLGIVVTAAGLLFALQGAGIIHWPRESSMVGHRDWVEYGIVIARGGVALLFTAYRVRR